MRVTVLYGGPSAEREISLISGKAVIDGLRSMGHRVFASDIGPGDLSPIDRLADVIFPVLHGAWGESGELQEILEQRGLAFVGSGAHASRIGMDKHATKQAWRSAGLPTPHWEMVREIKQLDALFSPPCVVKANDSGSSIDVHICHTIAERDYACAQIVSRYGRAMVEQFIQGPELTVGLLEEQPLAPIRIIAKRSFFDYEAKYKANDTEHRFDTGLPRNVVEQCRDLAREANSILGARDLARIDIMLDVDHNPYLLEINTLPGFTPKSLLPEAAAHAGIPFGQLVDRLVRKALRRQQAAA